MQCWVNVREVVNKHQIFRKWRFFIRVQCYGAAPKRGFNSMLPNTKDLPRSSLCSFHVPLHSNTSIVLPYFFLSLLAYWTALLCYDLKNSTYSRTWKLVPAHEPKLVEDLCFVELCLLKKKSASTKNLDKKTMDFCKIVISNTHEDEIEECMQVFRPFNVFNLLSVFLFVFFKILYHFKTMLLWILINRTCKNIENSTICKNIQTNKSYNNDSWTFNLKGKIIT